MSLRALIYNMQHMCKWDPIAYFDTYVAYYIKSSQGPEDGQNLTETCRPSIQV